MGQMDGDEDERKLSKGYGIGLNRKVIYFV